MVGISETKHL